LTMDCQKILNLAQKLRHYNFCHELSLSRHHKTITFVMKNSCYKGIGDRADHSDEIETIPSVSELSVIKVRVTKVT
jgi:hypothetical protein